MNERARLHRLAAIPLASNWNLDRGAAHTRAIPEELHTNAWIAERVTALIEQYSDAQTPFFCWASFLDPHPPYLPAPWDTMYDPDALTLPGALAGEHDRNAPHFAQTQNADPDFSAWRETRPYCPRFKSHLVPEDEQRRSLATYYGMVSLLDKYAGVILDRLDDLGLAENTLLVFTTDHGHLFSQHGLNYKGPFHYKDLLRVPLSFANLGPSQPDGDRRLFSRTSISLPPSSMPHVLTFR